MKVSQGPAVSGPMSSAGLVRYFDTSGGGLQITPELVLGLAMFFLITEALISYVF
ncbi:MAG: preprotein translocase subunit Sec61beta [Candidatus Diapherotrites archaeon]|nr:preprotein translocase subunit Sec61beta [Candidatus Diapherotrites archaeon]